jgi:hypothetical protein
MPLVDEPLDGAPPVEPKHSPGPAGRPGRGRWVMAPHRLSAIGAFVGVVAFVLARNTWIFRYGVTEDGDFAVNSILIDKARHLHLLVGNYSRVGFNHPGPALLYVQATAQVFLHDLIPILPRPYNAHVVGIVTLDALMIALCVSILVRRLGSAIYAPLLPVLALVFAWIEPGLLTSTWMPDVYVWPFLLFVVALASVLSGDRGDVVWFVLACCLLVHGHVSFVLFAAVGSLLVVGSFAWRVRRRGEALAIERRTAVGAAAIAGVFALPLALNLILHWPGELQKYWDYSTNSDTPHGTTRQVVAFVLDYWGKGHAGTYLAATLMLAAATMAFTSTEERSRRLLLGLMASVGIATALTLVYAKRGVDDLSFTYVARFYLTAPMITGLVVASAAVSAARRSARGAVASIAIVALIGGLAISRPQQRSPYAGANWVPAAVDEVDQTFGTDQPVAYLFDGEAWPYVAGLFEEARRRGEHPCISDAVWAFLFTAEQICKAVPPGRVVVAHPERPVSGVPTPTSPTEFYRGHGVVLSRG